MILPWIRQNARQRRSSVRTDMAGVLVGIMGFPAGTQGNTWQMKIARRHHVETVHKGETMKTVANMKHKILFLICCCFTLVIFVNILLHLISAGIRMIWFGSELVFLPVMIAVAAYLLWHKIKFK
jgi:hypothetical protein